MSTVSEWQLKQVSAAVLESQEAIELMNYACIAKMKTLNKRWGVASIAFCLLSVSIACFFLRGGETSTKLNITPHNYVVGKVVEEKDKQKNKPKEPIRKSPYNKIDAQIMHKAAEHGLEATFMIAQARLESGNYKKIKGNNLFNIKGKGQKFRTHEFYNGKKVYVTDSFRRYPSINASIDDYLAFLKDRYPVAYKGLRLKDKDVFLSGLMDGKYGKYATDPRYKQKISKLIRRFS